MTEPNILAIVCVIVRNQCTRDSDRFSPSRGSLCSKNRVVCDDEFALNFKIIESYWYFVSLLVQIFGIDNHLGSSVA